MAKLHGMTSALEAKRLEACDQAREEIRALTQPQEEASSEMQAKMQGTCKETRVLRGVC